MLDVTFKNYENKIKPTFMNYTDFESVLVSENNGKENPRKILYVACSYGVDDKLSNSRSYLHEYTVYSFLIVWLTKVNTVVMWWKYIYQRTCHD